MHRLMSSTDNSVAHTQARVYGVRFVVCVYLANCRSLIEWAGAVAVVWVAAAHIAYMQNRQSNKKQTANSDKAGM